MQQITVNKILKKTPIHNLLYLSIGMIGMYLWLCVFTNHLEIQEFILVPAIFFSPCLYLFVEYLWYNINVKVEIDEIGNKINYVNGNTCISVPYENIKSIDLWESPTLSILNMFYFIRIQLNSGERLILTSLLLSPSKKEIEQNQLFKNLNKKVTIFPSIVINIWWQNLPK